MSSYLNFCFPIRDLENELLKLTPFNPAVHGESFVKATIDHPEILEHLPFGPWTSVADIEADWLDGRIHPDPGMILFAVFDKKLQPEPTLAGTIGLLSTSISNLSTEIAFLIIFPKYQRTHVTTNAVGLLLQYCLDAPDEGGLGLRRAQWQATEQNHKSVDAAKKLGFTLEGIQRWQRVLPAGRGKEAGSNGIALRKGDPRRKDPGRNSAILAFCWDDWEAGGKTRLLARMKPRSS